jgi:hypothetical protein
MRKLILAAAVAVFGLGAGSANATVDVFAHITKDKDVTITETLTITKRVRLRVIVNINVEKFAEATSLINQVNQDNEGCTNCAEKSDEIVQSANLNSGILNINQAAGNMNNQASAVSVSVDLRTTDGDGTPLPPAPGSRGFAEALAANEQINTSSNVRTINLFFRDALIDRSFNMNSGIIHANQGTGNMANQANDVAMAVSFAIGGVALSEADLGQTNSLTDVQESDEFGDVNDGIGIHKTATIRGSINGNAGIVGINQSSGNFANQANKVAFAAVLVP